MSAAQKYDAVVIGSGFGGSINACRLAEKGKSALVLERGRRYVPGEFPRNVKDVDRLFWRYPRRKSSQGLFDVRFFSDIAAVVAAGVGGGSLVYANIHIRPDQVVFDDPRWPSSINRRTLEPYFQKVATALGISPLPAHISIPKRDAFYAAGEKMGRPVFDPDEAVNWPSEKNSQRSCRMSAECEFGCQYGAKNTLDFTYLPQAQRHGIEIRDRSLATCIEPQAGEYRVHLENLRAGTKEIVRAKRVIVSAGTLGTNELLLRCRDVFKTLPKLSSALGCGYSGNGDFLGSIQGSDVLLDSSNGPDVTSVMRFFEETPFFTMAAPTFNRPVMAVLASLGQHDGKRFRLLAPLLWRLLPIVLPAAFQWGLLSRPRSRQQGKASDPDRMTNLFAIGRDNANGRLHLRKKRVDIDWNYASENAELITRMNRAMEQAAAAYGGSFAPMILWSIFHRITTVHSLGGCAIADDPARGVVNLAGEVFGYPGLFVADGSVIPTSIGFHPVMTIAAVSEMIAGYVSR